MASVWGKMERNNMNKRGIQMAVEINTTTDTIYDFEQNRKQQTPCRK